MALPGSASAPAVDRRLDDFAYESGKAVVRLLEAGIRPRQILTKEAFENAIAVTMALGGSTNAVLHLLAIANEARVELELDDFNMVPASRSPAAPSPRPWPPSIRRRPTAGSCIRCPIPFTCRGAWPCSPAHSPPKARS